MTGFDIVKFIEARLAEDEAAAKRAAGLGGGSNPAAHATWSYDREEFRVTTDGTSWINARDTGDACGEHIARWDPARVLAEITAKRERLRLLGVAWNRLQDVQHDPDIGPIEHGDAIGRFVMVLRMVALDAAVWREHPDYMPEWAEPNWRPGS